jgi:hypothetical protein
MNFISAAVRPLYVSHDAVSTAINLMPVQVVLFDVQQRIVMGELSTPFVKYVIWSKDMSQVSLRAGTREPWAKLSTAH